MTEDEDADIARIAALRGRDANYYLRLQQTAAERITDQAIGAVYWMNADWRADLAAFDRLPEQTRAFVREFPMPLNAIRIDAILDTVDDEDAIAHRLTAMMPGMMRNWVLKCYGSDHPSVRKYG